MKAVIMAGGHGTRLQPLTFDRPKPMVPVAGKPVLEHLILLLRRHGFHDIIIASYYKPHIIEEAFGDGTDYGVRLRHVVEEQPLGTAGCIKQLEDLLTTTFVVLSGDALTDFPLTEAVETHRQRGALSTIVVTEVDDPTQYGIVTRDERGRVLRFLEKPKRDEIFSNTVNTGIYIFEPEVLQHCPSGVPFDFSRDLFPSLLQDGIPIYTHDGVGYWSDIGNCDQYIRSQMDALQRKVYLEHLNDEQPPTKGLWVDASAHVDKGAIVAPPAIVSAGVVVEQGAVVGPGTVVGRGARIGRDAIVKGSVLWDDVDVGDDAVVVHSAIGSGVTVEQASVVAARTIGSAHAIYEDDDGHDRETVREGVNTDRASEAVEMVSSTDVPAPV